MTTAMPDRLLSPEGDAWMLRCKLLKQAFDDRENGQYFARSSEVEEAFRAMSAAEFMEKFGG